MKYCIKILINLKKKVNLPLRQLVTVKYAKKLGKFIGF